MTTTAEPGAGVALYEESAPALRVPALPSLPDVDSWIRAMASIAKLADKICDTEFVPAAMRGKPDAVTAAILTGRELDLPPMLALRTINMIKGTPSLSAEYMRSKVLSLGHEFRIAEWDDGHCVIHARRRGDRAAPQVFEYTIAEARRAGLVRKNKDGSPGKYETDPLAMMLARATTRTCKAIFGDVVNGLATTELLESGDADAIGVTLELPAPPPPPVEDLRQRAAAQTATAPAEAVTPEPSPAATEASSSGPSSPPAAAAGEARSYAATLEWLQDKLGELLIHDADEKLRIVSKLGRRPLKRLDGLPPAKAAEVAALLEPVTDSAGLAALLDDIKIGDDPRGDTDE